MTKKNGTRKTTTTATPESCGALEQYARTPAESLYARALAAGADVVFVGDPRGGAVYTPETFTSRKRRPRRGTRT